MKDLSPREPQRIDLPIDRTKVHGTLLRIFLAGALVSLFACGTDAVDVPHATGSGGATNTGGAGATNESGGSVPFDASAGGSAGATGGSAGTDNDGQDASPPDPVVDNVDWPAFLGRLDLKWSRLPDKWESGAFMGNGLLGANLFKTDDGTSVRWHIGRTDVIYLNNRIPIGDLVLKAPGVLQGGDLRLDLWNAEVTGHIETDKGTIGVRSFTHTDQIVQVIELSPDAGTRAFTFDWVPGLAVNPRYVYQNTPVPDNEKNPAPQRIDQGTIHLAVQPLRDGGGHTTAWTEVAGANGSRVVLVSVGFQASGGDGRQQAIDALNRASATGLSALVSTHRDGWHEFWPESFVSIPDTRLESFYWIQMYKMASGTRADRPLLDLMGPWFRTTPWPKIWWNLNVQLTYWLQLTSNRLELGESLIRTLDSHKQALADNASPYSSDSYAMGGHSSGYDLVRQVGEEVGNLPWALHNYYLQYRYSMDEAMLRDQLFPLLKGSINYYLHILQAESDGYLHIIHGFSPEYPNQPSPNPDTNYDLSLLRWGLQTLLDTCALLKIDDPLVPKWKDTLAKLLPYPTDVDGYKVSASMPFAVSHRHYSHLLMVYPLYIVTPEKADNRQLVQKTLDHWMGLSQSLQGFSYTGAASMSALLGRGDDASNYLNKLLDTKIHPNTLYTESGPVIETPLSGAASVHDMLLSSWGGKIRTLPGLPAAWKDVAFRDFRTEGAFLVTLVRKEGKTQFIRIRSLAGEPCRLVTDMVDPVATGVPMRKIADQEYEIDLKKGDSVVILSGATIVDPVVAPVAPQADRVNFWGLH